MKKILHFKEAFVKRIARLVKFSMRHTSYLTVMISLKQKTRFKQAQGKEMEFVIHDEMAIAKVAHKELLSASKTKASLSPQPW